MKKADFVDSVNWDEFQHAYGPASDIPPLLKRVANARGRKLNHELDELCSRVLHQGSIYSASAPVVRALIPLLDTAGRVERTVLYGLLPEFADSARDVLGTGAGIADCCGGDSRDAAAIRKEILSGRSRFEGDLKDTDAGIRLNAARLLMAFSGPGSTVARLARERYAVETSPEVRRELLLGLFRMGDSTDLGRFLLNALGSERDTENRFLLRYAEICLRGRPASAECVDELIATFTRSAGSDSFTGGSNTDRFLQAAHTLGEHGEVEAIQRALAAAESRDLSLLLAQRLLRLVFEDRRTHWGQTSYSMLNADGSKPASKGQVGIILRLFGTLILWRLFPPLRRRAGRSQTKGKIPRMEYWGLEGLAPSIPETLNSAQRTSLEVIANHAPLWRFKTNLWNLFSLPESSDEMRRFAGASRRQPPAN